MIRRRTVVGLSLLSALVFSALAAQSASAALTTSKNTTAVTCVPEPLKKGHFEDEHCDKTHPKKEGAFTHAAIPNGSATKIEAINQGVTNETKNSEPAILKGTVSLVKTEIECSTVKNNVEKSTIENSEPEAKAHTLKGIMTVEFSACTVKSPAKCTVKEPIVANGTGHAVEGLEGPKGEKNAMGGEVIGSGEKETFAEITYEGAECALKGKVFKVQGKVIATNGPTTESGQENKESGATVVYTPKFGMQELKFGGAVAELSLITTVRMAEVEKGKKEPPITLTTAT